MALDFAAAGARLNFLAPGAIDTPMSAFSIAHRSDPGIARQQPRQRHALGRFRPPEEVAAVTLFPASDAAGFTTGAAMPMKGGWLAG